jgi:hypothetical protein
MPAIFFRQDVNISAAIVRSWKSSKPRRLWASRRRLSELKRFTDLGQLRSDRRWRQFNQTKPLNLGGTDASNPSRYVINQE